jgi:hypothetical protein
LSIVICPSSLHGQTIPPPFINYQAVLYDVNNPTPNAVFANQSFQTFVNINDELGNLLYREEHYASTDGNGLITVKMGDGLYVAGPITNFNQIDWGTGKYYLVVDFNINNIISSTAPEQLVTVPYSFYSGKAGNGMTSVADNGNGTLTFTYANGATYTTPTLSGIQGPVGATGAVGPTGPSGASGTAGQSAYELWLAQGNTGSVQDYLSTSAYQIWLAQGNTGTSQDFLNTLVGPSGASGQAGPQGVAGIQGPIGPTGPQGIQGPIGPAGAAGPQGIQGLTGLQGPAGVAGETGQQGPIGPTGPQGIQGPIGLTGAMGPQGPTGATGANGNSAYEIAVLNGFVGTETQWLLSLVGATGATGPQGLAGSQGIQGLTGPNGFNTLTKTTIETAGTNCINGGTKIETGLDVNTNGILDFSEINNDLTYFVCNGTNSNNSIPNPSGQGEILFWNGTSWNALPAGQTGQNLTICYGVPQWGPCAAEIITSVTTSITGISANSGGNITNSGGTAVTGRGVVYSTSPNPTLSNTIVSSGNGIGSFSVSLTNLLPNTTYYVRAYANNSAGTTYGNQQVFTTQIILPTVASVSNSIQSCSVVSLQGNLTTNGGDNATKVGFALSLNPNPIITDSIGSFVSSIGTFNQNAVSLSPNTLYYYRAFAINQAGIVYGSILSFTTPYCPPTVVTNLATNVTHNSAIGNGELTYNGGDANVTRGFCWGTVATPTISNSIVACGTGTGVFSCTMTGLNSNTTYYYRAYATNGAGTSYGQIFSFKTKGYVLLSSGTGTWTVPSGVTEVKIACWGGGGGGSGKNANRGSGGGGGAYSSSTISTTPGDVYNYSIGNGGAGSVASNSGGDTNFGNGIVIAKGGSGAGLSSYSGAIGGDALSCIGQVTFSGGNGGNGGVGSTGNVGGGGGAAGPTGPGGPGGSVGSGGGAGGIGNSPGGNGGAGSFSYGYGGSGLSFGGGGGGARPGGGWPLAIGGAGASGAIVITFDVP